MNPLVEVIERRSTGHGDIQLQRRDQHYEIIYNGSFLMATYNGESEKLLTKAALGLCGQPRSILIGGLGVGYTLMETLKDPRVRQVDVVEIEADIIDWNKRFFGPFNASALQDPRTHVIHADLVEWLNASTNQYDVICLDTDNGPDWIVNDTNAEIYSDSGLLKLRGMLAEDGILSFWSASYSEAFCRKLKEHFSYVSYEGINREQGEPDYVYLARR